MAQKRRTAGSEIRRLTDLVQEAVDDGATTAEEIHKRIAALPLDVLERLDRLEKTVTDVRKIQDQSIGAVYDMIRSINHEVAKMAKTVLAPAPPKRVRKASKPRKVEKQEQAA